MYSRHSYYLRKRFKLRDFRFTKPPSLSLDQALMLTKYGYWLMALDRGYIEPETEAQKDFVSVCHGEKEATTFFERTYVKYRRYLEAEDAEMEGRKEADAIAYDQIMDVQGRIEELGYSVYEDDNIWLLDRLSELTEEQAKIKEEREKLFKGPK